LDAQFAIRPDCTVSRKDRKGFVAESMELFEREKRRTRSGSLRTFFDRELHDVNGRIRRGRHRQIVVHRVS